MKIENLEEANRLSNRLKNLREARATWGKVSLDSTATAVAICDSPRGNLPTIVCDAEMHSAIVQSIVVDYDRRISDAIAELERLGVDNADDEGLVR